MSGAVGQPAVVAPCDVKRFSAAALFTDVLQYSLHAQLHHCEVRQNKCERVPVPSGVLPYGALFFFPFPGTFWNASENKMP